MLRKSIRPFWAKANKVLKAKTRSKDSFFILNILKILFGCKNSKNNHKKWFYGNPGVFFLLEKIQNKKNNHTFAAKYEKSY